MRKFEAANGWYDNKILDEMIEAEELPVKRDKLIQLKESVGINLPQRQTKNAAGYDFEAAEDVEIVPIWRAMIHNMDIKPQLVHTGVKAAMEPDEALFMYNRSGNPIKRFLLLGNGVGVVDSDYYGNESNDGEIMFQFWNFGFKSQFIKKGERIGQGVFKKFLLTDDDHLAAKKTRKGGHGSTQS